MQKVLQDGLSLNPDGTITGLKAGDTDDSATNKGQVDTAIWNATKKATTDADGNEYITGNDGKLYAKDDVDPTTGKPKTGATDIDPDTLKLTINANDGKAQQLGNVASALGATPTGTADDAKELIGGKDGKGGLLNQEDPKELNKVATAGDLKAIAQSGIDFEGNNSVVDDKVIHKTLASKLNIIGEGNNPMNDEYTKKAMAEFKSAKGNILVTKSIIEAGTKAAAQNETQLVVKLSKNLKGLSTVETVDDNGNKTVQSATGVTATDADGNTNHFGANGLALKDKDGKDLANLTKDGLKFADKKDGSKGLNINADGTITGVKETNDPTGVPTNGQVNRGFTKLGNEVGRVKDEARGIGALNAALAGLKPMQYDPLQRTQVMVGVGNYKDKQAVAVGAAHYFNENLMVNAGVSLGEGRRTESTANVGLTWKIGDDDDREDLPERYKEGPIGSIYMMQTEMDSLLQENQMQKEKIRAQEEQIKAINEKLEILMKNK